MFSRFFKFRKVRVCFLDYQKRFLWDSGIRLNEAELNNVKQHMEKTFNRILSTVVCMEFMASGKKQRAQYEYLIIREYYSLEIFGLSFLHYFLPKKKKETIVCRFVRGDKASEEISEIFIPVMNTAQHPIETIDNWCASTFSN